MTRGRRHAGRSPEPDLLPTSKWPKEPRINWAAHGWERVERLPYSGGLRHKMGQLATLTVLALGRQSTFSQPIKPTEIGGNVKALMANTAPSRVVSNEGAAQPADVRQIVKRSDCREIPGSGDGDPLPLGTHSLDGTQSDYQGSGPQIPPS